MPFDLHLITASNEPITADIDAIANHSRHKKRSNMRYPVAFPYSVFVIDVAKLTHLIIMKFFFFFTFISNQMSAFIVIIIIIIFHYY